MTKYYILEPLKSVEIKIGKVKPYRKGKYGWKTETNGGGIKSCDFKTTSTGIPLDSYRIHTCYSLAELEAKKELVEKQKKSAAPIIVAKDISDLI